MKANKALFSLFLAINMTACKIQQIPTEAAVDHSIQESQTQIPQSGLTQGKFLALDDSRACSDMVGQMNFGTAGFISRDSSGFKYKGDFCSCILDGISDAVVGIDAEHIRYQGVPYQWFESWSSTRRLNGVVFSATSPGYKCGTGSSSRSSHIDRIVVNEQSDVLRITRQGDLCAPVSQLINVDPYDLLVSPDGNQFQYQQKIFKKVY